MAHSYWKRRAQGNPLAVLGIVIVPKRELGEKYPPKYCSCYREAADEALRFIQEWWYRDVGATFRTVPSVVVYGDKTAAEYTQGNLHNLVGAQLDRQPPRYDAARQQIELCNPNRLFVFFTVGEVLRNAWGVMSGRKALPCADDPTNTIGPYSPGRTSACASIGIEILAGHEIDSAHPLYPPTGLDRYNYYYSLLGSIVHDLGHSVQINPDRGYGHPTEAEDGQMAWLSPMVSLHFFNRTDSRGVRGQFLPREREYLRGVPFFR